MFIHLKRVSLLVVSIIILTVAVVASVYWLTSFNSNQRYADTHQGCPPGMQNHKVIIQKDKVVPIDTVGNHCDTLTITNKDDVLRLVAFGLHDDHVPYDGVTERTLSKGKSLTVTMVQTGNFRFHDHIHDEAQGTFTVKAVK